MSCAGCAAKLNSRALEKILEGKNFYRTSKTMVGMENSDDAGVWRLPSGLLLVQSTDFFPPIVDDPFDFGRIAVANALSDIYVMGARPATALNLCFFPQQKYPREVYSLILQGAAETLRRAGCELIGGHTIEDSELKYGIAATGLTEEKSLITNSRAKPGDTLFLTKPLGTGIITTAIKADMCPQGTARQAIKSMTALNKKVYEFMVNEEIKAATDITGFGLAGHALEMCRASGVGIKLKSKSIPVFKGTEDLIASGMMPAGSFKNKENYIDDVDLNGRNSFDIIFDAQTSGGVLMAVPPEKNRKAEELFGAPMGKVIEKTESTKLIELI